MNVKNLILVIAIILIFSTAFMFLISHQAHPKEDTKIIMTSNANLTEGDNITIKLTDSNGTGLANQKVNVTIMASSGRSNQKVLTTDNSGQANISVDNTTVGNCILNAKYAGDDKFDGCNFTGNVIINQKVIIPVKTNSTNLIRNNTSMIETTTDTSYNDSNVITVVDE